MIDIVTEINATRREVAAGRAGADEAGSVRLRRRYGPSSGPARSGSAGTGPCSD
jgi:hypothetical protein